MCGINLKHRIAVGKAIEDLPEKFRKQDVMRIAGRYEHLVHGQTVYRTLVALERAGMIDSKGPAANVFIKTEKYGPLWKEAILV